MTPAKLTTISEATALIKAERKRQIEVEGWDAKHDDAHVDGSLAKAAECYFIFGSQGRIEVSGLFDWDTQTVIQHPVPRGWPWDPRWWKPKADPDRNLVIAGALYLAERDRLRRARKPVTNITLLFKQVLETLCQPR